MPYNSNYSINKHQYAQLVELKKITELADEKNIKLSVYGGYGFDGLVGWLTRDHHDFDLLVKDEHREAFKQILTELGYVLDEVTETKEVYKIEKLSDFKIEISTSEVLEDYLKAGEEEIFPSIANAKLYDFKFCTPSVKGHEHINEMQELKEKSKNAKGAYTHEESRKLLLNYLKKQKILTFNRK